MAEYRQRTVSKQKKDKLRLPEYTTRTVVIWGLKDEEKSASFIKGFYKPDRLDDALYVG